MCIRDRSILVWTDEPEWSEAVIRTGRAFGRALDQGVQIFDCATPLAEVMETARRQEFSLLVTHVSDDTARMRLVRRSPTSLLLVRGEDVYKRQAASRPVRSACGGGQCHWKT